LSISTALSIVLNASNDEKQIKEALEINNLKREDILFLNKKYLDYLSSIKPEDSVFINLENNLFIENNQMSSASVNKVNDLISDPNNHIDSTDKLVLINNFSFNAKFFNISTFVDDCQFKEESDSYVYLRIENISLCNEYLGYTCLNDLNFKACQLEYKKGFLMTIILPYDDASIDDIQLNSEIFEKILNQMKTNSKEYISLKIPKFKIQTFIYNLFLF